MGGNLLMELLFWCALVTGIFCIGYLAVIILYAGPGVNFSWIWSFGGFVCIIACFILRYFIRHPYSLPHWLPGLALTVLVITAAVFLAVEGMLLQSAHQTARDGLDCLLVLGAQIHGNSITKNLKKRLDTAVAYLKRTQRTRVVVSGGGGWIMSEAAAMKAYLLEQGIAPERIAVEDQSRDTAENMKFSKVLIEEGSSVGIVTNGFHLYRSIRLARKVGIDDVSGLAAPADRLMALHYYVREAAGLLKDWLAGNL
jgi:uncharacterized SAM-binding protein YcdF (DUF218 family)